MFKTPGFYLLEQYFRKCHSWFTSRGFRGLAPTILILINVLWASYPALMEFKNFKMNFGNCLLYMEFFPLGVVVVWVNIQVWRNPHRLLDMIDLLSDFNAFSIPQRLEFVDKNMKTVLKTIRYGTFLIAFLITSGMMLEDSCANFKNIKHCVIIEYYIPFDLKHWEITLILLFQTYTIGSGGSFLLLHFVLYYYSLELVIIRIENLNEMIDNIHLTKNKKRNFIILRPIVLYHQNIFRLFQMVNNFVVIILVPSRICVWFSLTVATTSFALRKDLTSVFIITVTLPIGILCHIIAQRFTTVAGSVADAIYNLNWYDADVSTRKDILILLCMSQRTLIIQAPLFGQLSNTAAADECKKVYVFYNWILTVMKKRNF